jgi:YggT family protein
MLLIATFLIYVLYAFIIAVLIRVVFSWVNPSGYPSNPIHRLAIQVTEPVMGPVRRLLPPMSGIDLSPLVVTLGAYFIIAALRNIA